ncbi:MAG: hypothetical protein JNN05_08460 [Candidatus Omnitrophica bacterium]|nr:hypothetical protein [Candidatus Omnitrophota bacterium]
MRTSPVEIMVNVLNSRTEEENVKAIKNPDPFTPKQEKTIRRMAKRINKERAQQLSYDGECHPFID